MRGILKLKRGHRLKTTSQIGNCISLSFETTGRKLYLKQEIYLYIVKAGPGLLPCNVANVSFNFSGSDVERD